MTNNHFFFWMHLITVLCFLTLSISLKAQKNFEYGISVGGMKYEGDIGGRYGSGLSSFNNKTSKSSFNGSLYLGYRVFDFLSLRISGTLGNIQAADSLLSGDSPSILAKKTRNAHFKSMIAEASLMAEIYPTVFFESDPYTETGKIRPYFLIGFGVFTFNPKGQYQETDGSKVWVSLQPLRTEGQGMSKYPDRKLYSLQQNAIQAGFGLKYHISERLGVSFELINRVTKTDYLDDVSKTYIDSKDFYTFFGPTSPVAKVAEQMANNPVFKNGGAPLLGWGEGGLRGSPKYNDYYYSSNIKLSYRFDIFRKSRGMLKLRGKTMNCPKPVL